MGNRAARGRKEDGQRVPTRLTHKQRSHLHLLRSSPTPWPSHAVQPPTFDSAQPDHHPVKPARPSPPPLTRALGTAELHIAGARQRNTERERERERENRAWKIMKKPGAKLSRWANTAAARLPSRRNARASRVVSKLPTVGYML